MLSLNLKRNNPPQKTQGKRKMKKIPSYKTQCIEWATKLGRPITWTELHNHILDLHGLPHPSKENLYMNRGFFTAPISAGIYSPAYFLKASKNEPRYFLNTDKIGRAHV